MPVARNVWQPSCGDDPGLQGAADDHAPRVLPAHALRAEAACGPAHPSVRNNAPVLSAPMPAAVT